MVGDWVCINGVNLPIAAISKDEEIGFLDSSGEVYWAQPGLDVIDPIPLTDRVLGHNFGAPDEDGTYRISQLNAEVYIQRSHGAWKILVDEHLYRLPGWRMFVCSVHDLQQALRLARIDVDIIMPQ